MNYYMLSFYKQFCKHFINNSANILLTILQTFYKQFCKHSVHKTLTIFVQNNDLFFYAIMSLLVNYYIFE